MSTAGGLHLRQGLARWALWQSIECRARSGGHKQGLSPLQVLGDSQGSWVCGFAADTREVRCAAVVVRLGHHCIRTL
jgi:hypothetical protein